MLRLGIVSAFIFAGCANDQATSVPVAPNDLNVSQVEVRHLTVNGDPVLDVRGFDVTGNEVGSVVLRTGMVNYNNEPGVTNEVITAGNEMTITVGEQSMTFISPDRRAHAEMIPAPVLEKFAKLAPIAAALKEEAGITPSGLASRTLADGTEASYSYSGDCDPNNFPSRLGGNSQCCWDTYSPGVGGYALHRRPDNTGLSVRGLYYACTNADGSRCYAGDACWYGPCGGHNYALGSINDSNAIAYLGHSDVYGYPMNCYADSNGWATGGYYENPTNIANNMLILFAGDPVGASCPYNHCDANGNPTP